MSLGHGVGKGGNDCMVSMSRFCRIFKAPISVEQVTSNYESVFILKYHST